MKKIVTFFLVLFAFANVNAQDAENVWSVSVLGGSQQYTGELGNAWYRTGQPVFGFLGLNANRYIDDRFDFLVQGIVGELGYASTDVNLRASVIRANIGLKIKLITDPDAKLVPYFTPGLGIASLSSYSYGTKTLNTWVSPSFALGLKYQINKKLAIFAEENAFFFQNNQPAKPKNNEHNALELQHTIGLSITLGEGKPVEVTTKVINDLPVVSDKTKNVLQNALVGVQFETGSDVIKSESFPKLDDVVAELKENPSLKLAINGYTDNTGDADKNLALSQKRADAVKAYLVGKGIDEARLKATGFGIANPVADNATPEGRAKNRRVEFLIF